MRSVDQAPFVPPVALIIAGGKGTRLGLSDLPKPMAPLMGMPLLEHQIRLLASQGITDIYILSGFLAEKIIDYFGDGQAWKVSIKHIVEKQALGTAGAIKQVEKEIKDDFLVLYGDVYLDLDLKALIAFHRKNQAEVSLVVHPNDHPQDSDLVSLDAQGRISAFHSKPHAPGSYYRNLVNAALYMCSPCIFSYIPEGLSRDFGKDIFPAMLEDKRILYAYNTSEYLKDMGTPERLHSVEAAIREGKSRARNLKNKQKAVFLDRDGVVNKEIGGVLKPEDLELAPDIADSIKILHEASFLVILVTNQPFIAKGMITFEELERIHGKMEWEISSKGAYFDALYVCPHHPEKGWPGEVAELKRECSCRKPEPGLILQALEAFNIDPDQSYIIGDRLSDLEAGRRAKLKAGLLIVPEDETLKDYSEPRYFALKDAVQDILKGNV